MKATKKRQPSPTANWFERWRVGRSMSKRDACAALGIVYNTLKAYEEDASKIPPSIALACAAISYGLPPMGHENNSIQAKETACVTGPKALYSGH